MYVYARFWIYRCEFVCIYFVHVCVHICLGTYVLVSVYARSWIYTCKFVCIYFGHVCHICVCTYLFVLVYTRSWKYTSKFFCIYFFHVCVCLFLSLYMWGGCTKIVLMCEYVSMGICNYVDIKLKFNVIVCMCIQACMHVHVCICTCMHMCGEWRLEGRA